MTNWSNWSDWSRISKQHNYWYRHNNMKNAAMGKNKNKLCLRGNKKWCEKYGDDRTLPRFIGDMKGNDGLYPPYDAPLNRTRADEDLAELLGDLVTMRQGGAPVKGER